MKTRISLIMLISALIFIAAACTTYVGQPQQGMVQVDPIYDPNATVIIVNGQRGYYGPGHVFFPVVMVGGVEGYYDPNHHFVSSAPAVRVAVQSHKPMYADPVKTDRPNYGSGPGTVGRGPSQPDTRTPAGKPNYGSGPGTAGRGPSSPAPAARPNYGSSGGSVGRGSSTPSSRPSYGGSSSVSRPRR